MIDWLLLLLYFVLVLITGFGMAQFALKNSEPMRAELWLPISFGLGLGTQCLVFLLFLLVLGKIYLLPATFIIISVAAIGLWWGRHQISTQFQGFEFFHAPDIAQAKGLYWIVICLIIFFLSLLYTNAASYPFTSYDGRAIWSFKAKVLLNEHSIFNEVYTDPYRIHYHRNYPLLIPFTEYSIYSLLGEVAERKVRFLFSSFFLFQVLYFFGILRRFGSGKILAIVFPLLYCATPFRDDWFERDGGALNSGAVDIPLSFFAMVSASSILLWWRERKPWQMTIGILFSALALMTKQEGLVIVAALFGANFVYSLFGRIKDRRRAFLFTFQVLLGSILLALPWFLVQMPLPNYYDENYSDQFTWQVFSQMHTRIPIIVERAIREIFWITKWNGYWMAYVALILFAIPHWFKRSDFWLDTVILLWVAAYFFVYMVSPLNLVFHLDTSISRLMSHFLPLVLLRLAIFFNENSMLTGHTLEESEEAAPA